MATYQTSWFAAPLMAPALLLATVAAHAEGEDTVKFNVGYTQMQDSNLFRLPANADVQALTGKSSAQENISIASLGISLNKAYSLQRIELDLSLAQYDYQTFSYLSYAAHNYNAAWRWSLTPRLRGNLTSSRSETLNSFTDFTGYNLRNQRTNLNTRLDATYEINGPWRLQGGVSQSSQTNLLPLVAEGDTRTTTADVGLRYDFASGSAISYTLRNANGTYVNRTLSASALQDDGYSQTDHELRLRWVLNGKTTADLSAAHISRSHPHFAQRDYSGLNAGASVNWNLSGKSALAASWARELASFQTGSANFSQTDRFSLGPVWQPSPKTVVRLRYEQATIDYQGSPTGLAVAQRSDTTRNTSLSLDWQPYLFLTLSAALQNAQRASTQAGLDYTSNMATFSAQYSY